MKTTIAILSASLCLAAAPALADIPREIKVGDALPDATVKTAEGADLKLREAVKTQPAVIIFYRGGWCPFCTRHLMALSEIEDDLKKTGFQLLAISADSPAKIAETPNRDKLSYTLLSDSTMEAAKSFGITFKVDDETVERYKKDFQIDLEAASGQTHHLLPHPAVYVADQEGTIRFAHVNQDYKTRLEPAMILETARTIAAAKP